ncbi:MAG: tRNA (adenosine(37)-N6)-dimethylallyltransferase MiaA [Alphaproteobacteria bacterium]|nr:tRNA (adenosine(37)-N6)-dimethylallyltransferase MiaA [Alphaproteobacteria bacterium]
MDDFPLLHLIGGPTASGKTARALELAQREGGVIINADAMQVYAGLPLLTAQPTPEEKAAAPHKLFEIFQPLEKSSAGRWLGLARAEIAAAVKEGQTPIVVGGTGMYFESLLGGLADIPPIPDGVRQAALALYEAEGHDAFRALLAKLDAVSAARIAPNDRQRLIRAYEVAAHTGKPLGVWQDEGRAHAIDKDFTVRRHLLMPDRAALYASCDARFLRMVEHGALEEVRGLLAMSQHGGEEAPPQALPPRGEGLGRGAGPDLSQFPAFKILGVPELAAHLRGELSLDEAIARAQQATRNYAKRQMTWFRHRWG